MPLSWATRAVEIVAASKVQSLREMAPLTIAAKIAAAGKYEAKFKLLRRNIEMFTTKSIKRNNTKGDCFLATLNCRG